MYQISFTLNPRTSHVCSRIIYAASQSKTAFFFFFFFFENLILITSKYNFRQLDISKFCFWFIYVYFISAWVGRSGYKNTTHKFCLLLNLAYSLAIVLIKLAYVYYIWTNMNVCYSMCIEKSTLYYRSMQIKSISTVVPILLLSKFSWPKVFFLNLDYKNLLKSVFL